MTNRLLKVIGISSILAAALSMSVYAETLTRISFEAGCDTEAAISSGEILAPLFVVNDTNAEYELASTSDTSSSESGKVARTYELTFEANPGFEWPSNASEVEVVGKGITEITKKTRDSDSTFVVKVKAYPYYAWPAPTFSDDVDLESGKRVSWSRPSGTTVEYLITWTTQSGETRHIHSTTSNSNITISSYNKKYTGTNTDMYTDAVLDGIAIRVKGNAGSNPHTAPSEWATVGSISVEDFDDVQTYDNWGDLFEGVSGMGGTSSSSKKSSSSGSVEPKGPGSAVLNGWQNINGVWYLFNNNATVKGWYNDGGTWYYLEPTSGIMQTGWIIDGGYRYYLNPNDGGPKGSMVTGTMVIDGKTCTFADSGALLSEQ